MDEATRTRLKKAYSLNMKGAWQAIAGDNAAAMATFSEAIEMAPEYAPPYYNRGRAHFEQGDFELAIADLTRAIDLDPNDLEMIYLRAHAFKLIGNDSRAYASYLRAVRLDPDDAAFRLLKLYNSTNMMDP